MLCALVFYFAWSRSKFKFEYESKEFKFLKDLNKGKTIYYFPFGHGP
jgi:hypothetical protein